ncbi:MAG: hypothetical protein CL943_04005 [Candidatus Diapherotrites archaeon]|uniref:Uncharacterized protein n=1 Tax=Candidatus Iainarchaeum sp. TaxID=3101447 RepID=A0A2D6M216_9ARCH|nr:hypothetical protein [Candidatus Diapherotrites archaeon]
MYPEGDAGAAPAADYGYDEGIKSKITRNLEGLIPLILIVIIAVFLLNRFDVVDIPFFEESEPIQMLVIGQPSAQMLAMLDQDKDLIYARIRDAASINVAPEEQLAQYDMVVLDQHIGTTAYDHSVSRQVGEALENYVKTGGKLVVIMDSGIYRSGGIYGTGIASDIIGWTATFGEIIPAECDRAQNDVPTCKQPIHTVGRVYRNDFDHRIMQGIEVAPADPSYPPLTLFTFDVKPTGNQVAYIKNEVTQSYYPAIVEKRLIMGKSLYFNYDPALTPGIWQNTLEYLR